MRTSGRLLLLAQFLVSTALAQNWPVLVQPPARANSYQKSKEAPHQYRTRLFEITSFKDHRDQTLRDFVICAESVPEVIQKLPLPLYAPPEKSPFQIHIHQDTDSFLAAGGAMGTAGFYARRTQTALLQWDFLFDRNTRPDRIPEPNFDLMIHELAHLSMHGLIPRIEVWLSEGIAEYLVAAHIQSGLYRFDKIDIAIVKRIKNRHPDSNGSFNLPPLSKLLSATSRDWLATSKGKSGDQALEPYDASLLLVHYSFHGGAERRKKTRLYFRQAHQGKPEALLFPVEKAPAIEKALVTYWKKKGLKLSFRSP